MLANVAVRRWVVSHPLIPIVGVLIRVAWGEEGWRWEISDIGPVGEHRLESAVWILKKRKPKMQGRRRCGGKVVQNVRERKEREGTRIECQEICDGMSRVV
jgi:hypothetical protein